MTIQNVPSLYDWVGGIEALNRLTTRFYLHVKADALLGPVFAHMGADHPAHVAVFLGEVLGGPAAYSEQYGGHPHMVKQHLNRHLTQEQRRRWACLTIQNFAPRWLAIWNGAHGWQSSIHKRVLRWMKMHPCQSGAGVK